MDSKKPSEQNPREYHQTTVRGDWKGRPSPGERGDGGPDDVQSKRDDTPRSGEPAGDEDKGPRQQ